MKDIVPVTLHFSYWHQGCDLRKITRNPKVPNHEILGAKHLSLYEKCKFFQPSKGKSYSPVEQSWAHCQWDRFWNCHVLHDCFLMHSAWQSAHRMVINISLLCVLFFFSNVRFFISNSLVMPAVVIRQRKAFRRKNGLFIYFEGELHTPLT